MEYKDIAKYISIGAIAFAVIHMFWPHLGIDSITLSLIVIAALPWLLPMLKSVELPGGVKIEFKDIKAALDKIKLMEVHLTGKVKAKSTAEATLTTENEESFETLRHVANYDPNLALVGFRIEIEKRLLKIAENNGVEINRRSLAYIVRALKDRGVLSNETVSGLMDLIALGNRAAHGAKVEPEAAGWVLDVGPSILESLDG